MQGAEMPIDITDRLAISDLLAIYGDVLDAGQYDEWPGLFAEECVYAVYDAADAERGLSIGYMLDDCRARVLDRVKFVKEVWRGTVEPYRTRHVAQLALMNSAGAGRYAVRSNFMVSYTQPDGTCGLLVAGRAQDVIQVSVGRAQFVERKLYLDGTPARYLVYPL